MPSSWQSLSRFTALKPELQMAVSKSLLFDDEIDGRPPQPRAG